jgi:hypothetical protein
MGRSPVAGSEQKSGVAERLKGKLQARKDRTAERARVKAELQRDRIDKQATGRKSFEGGGG